MERQGPVSDSAMDAEEIEFEEEEVEVEEEGNWEEDPEEEEEDPEEEEVIEEEEEDPQEEEAIEEEDPQEEEEEEDPEEWEAIEEEEEEEDPQEEEEEAIEEELVEEEEEEPANEDVDESSTSPSRSSVFQKDVERDSKFNRLDRHLASCTSRPEGFSSCPESNSDDGVLKTAPPSDEQSTTVKDTCLSFENSVKEPASAGEREAHESCVSDKDSERPTGNLQVNNLSLENDDKPRVALVSLRNTRTGNAAGEKTSDSVPSRSGTGQKSNGACISGDRPSKIKAEDENIGTKPGNTGFVNPAGENGSDSVPGSAGRSRNSNAACSSGKNRSNIKFEDDKCGKRSRLRSFSPGGEMKEPQRKRAEIACEFFAKGWCIRGKSCRFLHVKDTLNNTSRQQGGNNLAGSSEARPCEERTTSDNRVRGIACQSRVVSYNEHIGFISSSKDMGRERLKQNVGADGLENRSLVCNNGKPSNPRSSFIHEHRYSASSGNSFHASPSGAQRQFENKNKFYGLGTLLGFQGLSVSSRQDPEGETANKKAKISSNDWEPSEPFRPSFTIPSSILPAYGTIYDLFLDGMDVQTVEDSFIDTFFSSKGEEEGKMHHRGRDGDSVSGPRDEECNDDVNGSSCSQNQYKEAVPEKKSELHFVEMVATSVVEQNKTTPENENYCKAVPKRSKATGGGYDSWQKSDMSSNIKISREDREGRTGAGTKGMSHFRTALIDTIKEMLKPIWREGRLSKEAHNRTVKMAAEKVIRTAVQFHQVPTDTESIEQYLSVSQTKIVKLVEGYVAKFRTH
ncbi:PREDICTED: protein FRIGIDA-ESSENTIAL 1-like isoform X2 [Tarenaya hassleriana]|uniref:protein FRIGIDA-ESSENTIAL 1-like isoform X2 n=1 Tax=Tarenaya hassleriana TaxID=28532 RepID=UPI00053C8BE0|nr:PREDICTED: protein FRIGIDA-ESSENTIAL 1-like isoform X2 [Tarenaya hassleriana]